jgi:capsule biosynthesis phosphatase
VGRKRPPNCPRLAHRAHAPLSRPGTAPLIAKRIRFCFDLDNTLVTLPKVPGDYTSVEPIPRNIELVRQLHAAGHHIIIQTSRGMRDHAGNLGQVMRDVGRSTFNSLHDFDIPYDELIFGKPEADVYVGHRAVNSLIDTIQEVRNAALRLSHASQPANPQRANWCTSAPTLPLPPPALPGGVVCRPGPDREGSDRRGGSA